MSKVWFTADTHFGHLKTLQLSKRHFETISKLKIVRRMK